MKRALLSACWLLCSSAVLLCRSGQADTPVPPAIAVPQPVEWLMGPTKASIGPSGDLNVLRGYRFLNSQDASSFLEAMKVPVPSGLVGMLAPVVGDWYMLLTYADSGFVKESAKEQLDENALLKSVWGQVEAQNSDRIRQGRGAISHIQWQLKPEYDAKRHLLESAIRHDGRSENDNIVEYTARFLGRVGVLTATLSRPLSNLGDLELFRSMIKASVAFKEGQRYTDHQVADKEFSGGMAGLVTGIEQKRAETTQAAGSETMSGFQVFWVGLGVIGCVGIAGGVLLSRRLRQQKALAPATESEPAPLRAPRLAVNGSRHQKPTVRPAKSVVNNHANGNGHTNGNGHANGNGNGNGTKRRRMFNYHKFYTEMVLQGPAPTVAENYNGYAGFNGYGYNGYEVEPPRQNGNGHASEAPAPEPSSVVSANSSLIANQRSLIEEQKRLITEQARLIEEKSKLIAEKNHLLDRQSQMIDNNLL